MEFRSLCLPVPGALILWSETHPVLLVRAGSCHRRPTRSVSRPAAPVLRHTPCCRWRWPGLGDEGKQRHSCRWRAGWVAGRSLPRCTVYPQSPASAGLCVVQPPVTPDAMGPLPPLLTWGLGCQPLHLTQCPQSIDRLRRDHMVLLIVAPVPPVHCPWPAHRWAGQHVAWPGTGKNDLVPEGVEHPCVSQICPEKGPMCPPPRGLSSCCQSPELPLPGGPCPPTRSLPAGLLPSPGALPLTFVLTSSYGSS